MICQLYFLAILLLNVTLAAINPVFTAKIIKAAREDNLEQVNTLLREFQDDNFKHERRMAFKSKEGQMLNQLNADRCTSIYQPQLPAKSMKYKTARKGLLRQLRAERRLLIAVQEAKDEQVLKVAHIVPQKIIELHLKYSCDKLRRTADYRYVRIVKILLKRIYKQFDCEKCLDDLAASKGDYDSILSLVIAKGTAVRVGHVYSAVKSLNPKTLRVLLQSIQDINVVKHDRRLLRAATSQGRSDIVRILLSFGVVVTSDDLNIMNYSTDEIYELLKRKYDEQNNINSRKAQSWLEAMRSGTCFGDSCAK